MQQFGDIKSIYEHIDEVKPPRIQGLLKEHQSQAMMSVELARIVVRVPLDLDFDACARSGFNREAVVALFREMEFSSLLARLPGGDGEESAEGEEARASGGGEVEYHTVTDEDALDRMIAEVREAGYFRIRHGDNQPERDDGRSWWGCRYRRSRERRTTCRLGT